MKKLFYDDIIQMMGNEIEDLNLKQLIEKAFEAGRKHEKARWWEHQEAEMLRLAKNGELKREREDANLEKTVPVSKL